MSQRHGREGPQKRQRKTLRVRIRRGWVRHCDFEKAHWRKKLQTQRAFVWKKKAIELGAMAFGKKSRGSSGKEELSGFGFSSEKWLTDNIF